MLTPLPLTWKRFAAVLAGLAFSAGASAQPTGANECGNATPISGVGTFAYNTNGATSSGPIIGYQGVCPMMYNDVWFRWTAPASGLATMDSCNTTNGWGSTIAVYNNCADALPSTCGNDWAASCQTGWNAALLFNVIAGRQYLIRLDTGQEGVGTFTLGVAPGFPGDDCNDPIVVSGSGTFPLDTSGATDSEAGAYIGKDVWYRWTAPTGGQTYATTCGAPFASIMAVYPDGCAPLAPAIAANDDDPGCPENYGTASRVDFFPQAGATYLIRVGSVWGSSSIENGSLTIVHDSTPQVPGGETVTVSTTEDTVDIQGFRRVADLPGPDGKVSFREAVIAANNTAGPQTIGFAIPQSEWYYQGNVAEIINAGGDPYFLTDDGTVIDGATQTTAIGDTNPDGPDVGFWSWNANAGNSPNLIIEGNGCVMRGLLGVGLMGYPVWVYGNNTIIQGCVLSPAIQGSVWIRGGDGTLIGGSGQGNVLGMGTTGYGVLVDIGSEGTVIAGNTIGGYSHAVRVVGATNTRIGGPGAGERNIMKGAGHYGAEGFPTGAYVSITDSSSTLVENNLIGLSADGLSAGNQAATAGIAVSGSSGTTIRGNSVGGILVRGANHYANRIFGTGLSIGSGNDGLIAEGNTFGQGTTGGPVPNLWAISVGGVSTGVRIGGAQPGQGNTIAHSQITGVSVGSTSTGITVAGNSIFGNQQMGIDLLPAPNGPAGPTPNDAGDADTGGNNLQNFPVLSAAMPVGGSVTVAGSLDSMPSSVFRVEVFANAACGANGFGQGEAPAGVVEVSTDATGHAEFSIAVPAMPGRSIYSATATRGVTGDTSEFSACLAVAGAPLVYVCRADFNGAGGVGVQDLFDFLAAWFSNEVRADFDGSTEITVQDLFTFLGAWFARC